MSELNKLTEKIIGLAIDVHKSLGSGFVEKIYARAMELEFGESNIKYLREKSINVCYKNINLGNHRLDFLIEDRVILELKAIYRITNFHIMQMLSYLKAADKKVGLILNFSQRVLEIKRVVNNY